jgi:RNA methyltransferase, TrmH family
VVEDLLASDLALRWVASTSSMEDSPRGADLARRIEESGVTRRLVDEREFATLSQTDSPQGVMAIAQTPHRRLEDVSFAAPPAVLLVVDGVQDPGNFGTLVRSAEALGAVGVVSLSGTVDPWNPKSVRAAAGSLFRLPVVQVGWEEAAEFLRGREVPIYGAAAEGRPVHEVRCPRAAVVVGNEGAGLSEAVRGSVDALIGIPLRGRAESLNVAAAAAILLYELTR